VYASEIRCVGLISIVCSVHVPEAATNRDNNRRANLVWERLALKLYIDIHRYT